MIGFLLRKTFYDGWDNLFRIVLLNLGFLLTAAFPVFVPGFVSRLFGFPVLDVILTAAGIFLCSVYLAAAAHSLKSISDYGTFGFADFFRAFKVAWPAGIAMGIFLVFLVLIVRIVLPFYLSMESLVGLVLAVLIIWIMVFALFSFQFFFAVHARLGTNLKKVFKKCMLISLDNTGFIVFSLLHNIAAIFLSAILAFMFPGPAGVLLFLDQGLRLRLLKYDWLEANPEADRKKIPWDVLLIEEREKTGTRSFRNFIFPWKD
ncbi:MAG: hypothetical protein FWC36_00170 [Spirochaetes bacterium]|nr:hypothetical protein [Spirochaetota bacterium]